MPMMSIIIAMMYDDDGRELEGKRRDRLHHYCHAISPTFLFLSLYISRRTFSPLSICRTDMKIFCLEGNINFALPSLHVYSYDNGPVGIIIQC